MRKGGGHGLAAVNASISSYREEALSEVPQSVSLSLDQRGEPCRCGIGTFRQCANTAVCRRYQSLVHDLNCCTPSIRMLSSQIRTSLLGEDHPDVADSLNSAGIVAGLQKRHGLEEDMHRRYGGGGTGGVTRRQYVLKVLRGGGGIGDGRGTHTGGARGQGQAAIC